MANKYRDSHSNAKPYEYYLSDLYPHSDDLNPYGESDLRRLEDATAAAARRHGRNKGKGVDCNCDQYYIDPSCPNTITASDSDEYAESLSGLSAFLDSIARIFRRA